MKKYCLIIKELLPDNFWKVAAFTDLTPTCLPSVFLLSEIY
jgi:hypothetical protein